jgi:hypothetical protein
MILKQNAFLHLQLTMVTEIFITAWGYESVEKGWEALIEWNDLQQKLILIESRCSVRLFVK